MTTHLRHTALEHTTLCGVQIIPNETEVLLADEPGFVTCGTCLAYSRRKPEPALSITDEDAEMLAQHARIVQGGFSTPEIERERIEQSIAEGRFTAESLAEALDTMRSEVRAALQLSDDWADVDAGIRSHDYAPIADRDTLAKHLRRDHGFVPEAVNALALSGDHHLATAHSIAHAQPFSDVAEELLADYDPVPSLVARGVMADPEESAPYRPRFTTLWITELQDREPGTPFTDVDGNEWMRVVFGRDGVCAAEDTDGEIHVWDSRELFEAVFRTMRHTHEESPTSD